MLMPRRWSWAAWPMENPCRHQALQCDTLSKKQFALVEKADGVKATFDNLSAIKQEAYALPLDRQLPMVLFAPSRFSYLGAQGSLATWHDFGVWQYGLLKGRSDLPAALKQKVHELTDALPTKRDKIARLYQYLYDNTRYVSICLSIRLSTISRKSMSSYQWIKMERWWWTVKSRRPICNMRMPCLCCWWGLTNVKRHKEICNQFASFKVTYQKDRDIVRAHYRLIMNEGTFSASQMSELTKTLKAISAAYRQQLVLFAQDEAVKKVVPHTLWHQIHTLS